MAEKCSFDGAKIKIGDTELDPCEYVETEKYRNVTVTISRCKNCGHVDISWEKQEDTEKIE